MEKPKIMFAYDHENNVPKNKDKDKDSKDCNLESLTETKLIKDFGSYTTLHGFHFIFDSGTTHRRIFWFFLMVFGFAALTAQIFYNICRLHSNETRIRKSIEQAQSLHFPAITICNQNMLKKSKIKGSKAQDYLDQLDHLKFGMGQKTKNVPPFDMDKAVRESGHQIHDMIYECQFTDKLCSWKNFTPATMSFLHGNCYTFNAGNNNSSVATVESSGKMQSLTLRLDSEPQEYYGPYSYDATGFKIAVHDHETHMDMDEEGYDVSPGFYTSMRIRKNKEISLPPPYHTMCGSRPLFNYQEYSQAACQHECISKILARECNCRILSMIKKGVNVTRYCSTDEIRSCVYPAYRLDTTDCDCPKECESISYKVQLSTAYYPSEHLWDTILPLMFNFTGLNASIPQQRQELQTFVRKRYAMVTIFFETLDTDIVQEVPSYTLTNFWSDIGGNMGLFLGCSMMTVCEFIDLTLMILINKWRKAREVATCQVQSLTPAS